MKQNVLVFPCGSEIGLEIYRSLNLSTHFKLYGGSSVKDHGEFVYENYIGEIPSVSDLGFIDKLNKLVAAHDIRFIIPAHDDVLLKLAQERSGGNLGCEVITSPFATCEITRSKLKTYEALRDTVPVPKIYSRDADLNDSDFPIFLKPEKGQGSKDTNIARSRKDVEFYCEKDPTLLLLEYLPGKEYTVDCFTNKRGELLFSEGRLRQRILNGISVNSVGVSDNSRFTDLAARINKSLELRGAWFFQVKENKEGKLVLMEVAPRIAGTMGLARCKGVNLPLLSLFMAMGYEVDVLENNYEMTIDRALQNSYKHNISYAHVYLDLDDLVIFEGKVNPMIMAFVYQCINNKIKVHLITKHKEDLNSTLERHKLDGVFDELILLKDTEEKHTYIKEKDAIFIDDSFAERESIYQKSKIPVFDSHMVESLMESF